MKNIIIFVALILKLNAQIYYNVVIPSNQSNIEGISVPALEHSDSSISMFVRNTYRYEYGGSTYKLELNKEGELIGKKKLRDSLNQTSANDLIRFKNYNISCGLKLISIDTLFELWIAKISMSGEIEWEKQIRTFYDHPSFTKCKSIQDDNKLVFVGSYDQRIPRSSISLTASGLIVITDTLANVEHFITINDNDTLTLEAYYCVTEDYEHNIYACGIVGKNGQNHDAVVVKVSPYGKVLWRKQYPSPDYSEAYIHASFMSDSSIQLVGSSYSAGSITEDYSNVLLSKISLDGDILWSKQIMKGFDDEILRCISDVDGNITCVGVSHIDQSSKANGLVLKFSPKGDSIWSRVINKSNLASEQFNNISKAYDGGYYLTGFSWVDGDFSSKPWIVKTDNFGCVVPGCEKVVSVQDIKSGKEKAFVLHPNPVQERFFFLSRITSSEPMQLIIYNLQGQIMQNYKFAAYEGHQYEVELKEGITAGYYLVQIQNAKGDIVHVEKMEVY